MKFSRSLEKNIIKSSIGRIINTFKVHSRRNVLFSEEILAYYIKECEANGYKKEIRDFGKKLTYIVMPSLMPAPLRKLPLTLILNRIAKRIWVNIGVLDNLHATKKGNIINIETKNQFISRIIGENEFCTGFFEGIVGVLSNHQVECIEKIQSIDSCVYKFCLKEKQRQNIKFKDKKLYNHLNNFSQIKGFELKYAIKKNFFTIKYDNKIYFRDKIFIPMENTLFHLLSNSKLLTDRIPYISHSVFNDIIEKNTSQEEKLTLLKNFLQVTGWGIVTTTLDRNKIVVFINNPPYGMQTEKDNWDFLARLILGFLWNIDKYSIKNTITSNRLLKIEYCV